MKNSKQLSGCRVGVQNPKRLSYGPLIPSEYKGRQGVWWVQLFVLTLENTTPGVIQPCPAPFSPHPPPAGVATTEEAMAPGVAGKGLPLRLVDSARRGIKKLTRSLIISFMLPASPESMRLTPSFLPNPLSCLLLTPPTRSLSDSPSSRNPFPALLGCCPPQPAQMLANTGAASSHLPTGRSMGRPGASRVPGSAVPGPEVPVDLTQARSARSRASSTNSTSAASCRLRQLWRPGLHAARGSRLSSRHSRPPPWSAYSGGAGPADTIPLLLASPSGQHPRPPRRPAPACPSAARGPGVDNGLRAARGFMAATRRIGCVAANGERHAGLLSAALERCPIPRRRPGAVVMFRGPG